MCVEIDRERDRERDRGSCLHCNHRVWRREKCKRSLPLCFHCCIPLTYSVFCSLWTAVVFPTFGFSTLNTCVISFIAVFLFQVHNLITRLWPSIVEAKRILSKGYKECTFGPRASRRFPLWSAHPPDENPPRMPVSSSCPTEIRGLKSLGMCRATWKVKLYSADYDNSTVLRVFDSN